MDLNHIIIKQNVVQQKEEGKWQGLARGCSCQHGTMSASAIQRQFEELQLIAASLLPSEHISFYNIVWEQLLASDDALPDLDVAEEVHFRITVKEDDNTTWIDVQIPPEYPQSFDIILRIGGDQLGREVQASFQNLIEEKLSSSVECGSE